MSAPFFPDELTATQIWKTLSSDFLYLPSLVLFFLLGWGLQRWLLGAPARPAAPAIAAPAATSPSKKPAAPLPTRASMKSARQKKVKPPPTAPCPDDMELKMVLLVRRELKLPVKAVAELCSQAAMDSVQSILDGAAPAPASDDVEGTPADWLRWWNEEGVAKVTLRVDGSAEDFTKLLAGATAAGIPSASLNAPSGPGVGSVAVAALGPAPVDLLDPVTGSLKLL